MKRTTALCLLTLAGCRATAETTEPGSESMDVHSYADSACRVRHVSLDLTADFDARRLSGRADLEFTRAVGAARLLLDTRELAIERVTTRAGDDRTWRLQAADGVLGQRLEVDLEPGDSRVRIHYRTDPGALAVQWLKPEQTSGEQPFLFTQGQAILTRSWIPLQDSPSVRVTYDATIRTPAELGLTAVMSAEQRTERGHGVFEFRMTEAIPPYLIALAIGRLEKRDISARCAVWAEPAVIDRAAAELDDTEAMLAKCEELFGPYRWGRYDVLVLPPAFPFGGMENPCMTFATPTILAGDKSLVALIAHELAHSWSGNLVTNATWRDFWLNEGFTVFLEQRIMAALYGDARAAMETLHGLRGLEQEIAELPPADQVLHVDLTGRNPDDGMTAIAYDKGAAFLRRLEEVHGRERFDAFLTEYFDAHAFESITTAEFLAYLDAHLLRGATTEQRAAVDVQEWVYGPGLPADCPRPDSPAFDQVDAERQRFLEGAAARDLATDDWVTMQWLHFLSGLQAKLPELPADDRVAKLAALDQRFGFRDSGNSEILAKWLEVGIRNGYGAIDAALEQFLLRVGRRKFLTPLYRALIESGAKPRALEIYEKARPRYHAVATQTLDQLLGRGGDD